MLRQKDPLYQIENKFFFKRKPNLLLLIKIEALTNVWKAFQSWNKYIGETYLLKLR